MCKETEGVNVIVLTGVLFKILRGFLMYVYKENKKLIYSCTLNHYSQKILIFLILEL